MGGNSRPITRLTKVVSLSFVDEILIKKKSFVDENHLHYIHWDAKVYDLIN